MTTTPSPQSHRNIETVRIVDYDARYRTAFKTLNEAWIIRYFQMEDADRRALEHPESYVLDRGGHILVALADDEPVGVCALLKMDDAGHTYELAKMAVAPHAQGRGIGEKLGRAAMAWAQARGAQRLYLESNTKLEPAIRLYRKLGFAEVTGHPTPYARCNIQMELELGIQRSDGRDHNPKGRKSDF